MTNERGCERKTQSGVYQSARTLCGCTSLQGVFFGAFASFAWVLPRALGSSTGRSQRWWLGCVFTCVRARTTSDKRAPPSPPAPIFFLNFQRSDEDLSSSSKNLTQWRGGNILKYGSKGTTK